jgi:hypothetical protein
MGVNSKLSKARKEIEKAQRQIKKIKKEIEIEENKIRSFIPVFLQEATQAISNTKIFKSEPACWVMKNRPARFLTPEELMQIENSVDYDSAGAIFKKRIKKGIRLEIRYDVNSLDCRGNPSEIKEQLTLTLLTGRSGDRWYVFYLKLIEIDNFQNIEEKLKIEIKTALDYLKENQEPTLNLAKINLL